MRGILTGVGDEEQITVTVVINGGVAELTIQKSEIEGTVSSVTGACPAVTFTIGSTKVSTDATTTFFGGPCGQLANGGKAEAAGPKQLDGSIKATTVNLEDNGTNPPPGSQEIQLDGTSSALTGSCPVISFTVTGTKAATDASTSFTGGVCQQVANGGRVQVKGFQQNDGSVRATEVSVKDVQETQLDGAVSALTGACPVVTFAVAGTKVATDASTSFTGGACQQLANGQRVQREGPSCRTARFWPHASI